MSHLHNKTEHIATIAHHSLLSMIWNHPVLSVFFHSKQTWRETQGTLWLVKVKWEINLDGSESHNVQGLMRWGLVGLCRYVVKGELRLQVAMHCPGSFLHTPGCWLALSYCTTVGFANLSSKVPFLKLPPPHTPPCNLTHLWKFGVSRLM